jgi:hypothetical protein
MRNVDALEVVQARRDEIARELDSLRHEDQQLEIAEQALRKLAVRPAPLNAARILSTAPAAHREPRSQREVVLQVLREAKEPWMRSGEIVDQAHTRWSIRVPEKSLRPLLSVMKREGAIVRRGRLIAATDRAFAGSDSRRTARRD